MLRTPSGKRAKKKPSRINLIPILDAVFIFIFFLLMSANFIKVFEINSDVPIVSDSPPPKDKKPPLALTLTIKKDLLEVATGVPSSVQKRISNLENGNYNLVELRTFLINLKKRHLDEETIVLQPIHDLDYQQIVEIMDAVRKLENTDEAIFKTDKDGIEVKVEDLFSNNIFGNIMS
jgi:biopolymer transport protein ExbD